MFLNFMIKIQDSFLMLIMYLSSFYRLFLAFIYNNLIHKLISKYFIHLLLADTQNMPLAIHHDC